MSIISYNVHPNPPTCKLHLYLDMGNIWRVICMDCSISLFFSFSFLYVLYRSILSIYLLIPLERERQDNMKQPRLATSSKIKLPSLSYTPPMNSHPYYLIHLIPSTPPNPFLLPPSYPSYPSFPSFPTSLLQSPTYIHKVHTIPRIQKKKENPVNPTFEPSFSFLPGSVFSFSFPFPFPFSILSSYLFFSFIFLSLSSSFQ